VDNESYKAGVTDNRSCSCLHTVHPGHKPLNVLKGGGRARREGDVFYGKHGVNCSYLLHVRFKIIAIELSCRGFTSDEILSKYEFDPSIFRKKYFKSLLKVVTNFSAYKHINKKYKKIKKP